MRAVAVRLGKLFGDGDGIWVRMQGVRYMECRKQRGCQQDPHAARQGRVDIKLGLLSNRALLVNNLLDLALYAGNRVVSAVGMKPPHDGRSRVRPPKVSRAVRIGRNEPTRMASPTSRQGHRDSTSEECTNTVNSLLDLWCYGAECWVECCS